MAGVRPGRRFARPCTRRQAGVCAPDSLVLPFGGLWLRESVVHRSSVSSVLGPRSRRNVYGILIGLGLIWFFFCLIWFWSREMMWSLCYQGCRIVDDDC